MGYKKTSTAPDSFAWTDNNQARDRIPHTTQRHSSNYPIPYQRPHPWLDDGPAHLGKSGHACKYLLGWFFLSKMWRTGMLPAWRARSQALWHHIHYGTILWQGVRNHRWPKKPHILYPGQYESNTLKLKKLSIHAAKKRFWHTNARQTFLKRNAKHKHVSLWLSISGTKQVMQLLLSYLSINRWYALVLRLYRNHLNLSTAQVGSQEFLRGIKCEARSQKYTAFRSGRYWKSAMASPLVFFMLNNFGAFSNSLPLSWQMRHIGMNAAIGTLQCASLRDRPTNYRHRRYLDLFGGMFWIV